MGQLHLVPDLVLGDSHVSQLSAVVEQVLQVLLQIVQSEPSAAPKNPSWQLQSLEIFLLFPRQVVGITTVV